MSGRPVLRTLAKWVVLAVFLLAWTGLSRPLRGETKKIPAASSYLVYVGTYTAGTSKGIYNYHFDPKTGQLTPIGVAAEVVNPSFLAPTRSIASSTRSPRWDRHADQTPTKRTALSAASLLIARPAALPFSIRLIRAEGARAIWWWIR